MKKIPWGILTGICAILVFYLTASVVGGFFILNSIAGQTNTSATLFDNWWQTLLFILDVIFIMGMVASMVMFFLKKKSLQKKEEKV